MEVEQKFPASALSLTDDERQKPKPIIASTDSISQKPKQSDRLRKRKQDQTIVESFGELNQFNRTSAKLRKLLVDDTQSKDMSDQIQSLQNVLKELEKLKNEFQLVVGEKRQKLDQVERISNNLLDIQRQKQEMEETLKVEIQKNAMQNKIPENAVLEETLTNIPVVFRSTVRKCLVFYPDLVFSDGILGCKTCRDDWAVAVSDVNQYTEFL